MHLKPCGNCSWYSFLVFWNVDLIFPCVWLNASKLMNVPQKLSSIHIICNYDMFDTFRLTYHIQVPNPKICSKMWNVVYSPIQNNPPASILASCKAKYQKLIRAGYKFQSSKSYIYLGVDWWFQACNMLLYMLLAIIIAGDTCEASKYSVQCFSH